ncbi:MAG: UbiD family decarboxylase [Chloroflexi bacterium]|nr:UbiD family decarboxylase [Chloroflexota bacterium]
MAYYRDLREYLKVLESKGKLVRINREINKDTELMPLVRWQFRGLPEEQRKAFIFDNVKDAKGKKYDMPVVVAAHAPSREVYALAMMCAPDKIIERWTEGQLHPIEPVVIESGPVHENIHQGDELITWGGLGHLPVPISTPGFDNAPYLTCSNWVSKDPDTGIRNMGIYRGMLKSATRLGIQCDQGKHLRIHWEKCRNKGIPLQVAVVVGASPNLGFVGAAHIPYGVDEFAIAGGLSGEPIKLVKCKTVNIEVPATAEIVIEGEMPTDSMEKEGPFGEFTGYMGAEGVYPYFNVKCITHRNDAIYTAFISQFAPSESSKLRQISQEGVWYKLLKHDLNNPGVLRCAFHENASGSSAALLVIQLKKAHPFDAWHALDGAAAFTQSWPRIIIAVDEDIDPEDADSVNWALSFRMEPHRDLRVVQGKAYNLDQASNPPWTPQAERFYPSPNGSSVLLIDATRKWPYRPVSLPARKFMERAKQIWEEEKLPRLIPRSPWFGYSLGQWTDENKEEAELALNEEHYQTGEKIARQRTQLGNSE